MKLQEIVTKGLVLTEEQLKLNKELLRQVQERLSELYLYPPGMIDGLWGTRTEHALIQFCKQHHLNNIETNKYGQSWAKALLEASVELITKEQAENVYGHTITHQQLHDLNACLRRFDINTPPRMRHFLAQTGHESCGLRYTKEIASGRDYEGRKDLGNTQPGDGVRFKGAGVIQLTGRANYTALSKFLNDPRVLEGCAYVSIMYPFTSAGFFWYTKKLNQLCDRGATVEQITRVVNGGYRGLTDRKAYYVRACRVIA